MKDHRPETSTALPARSRALHTDVLGGAASGTVATLAMSAVMLGAQRLGRSGGTQPPERIVEAGLNVAHVDRTERTQNALASVVHIGFGATCGVGYRLARRVVGTPGPRVLQGVAFGLAVWFVSYQGWIPWLRILPPPEDDRPDRPRMMVLAHLVYGAVLGALAPSAAVCSSGR